MLIEFHRTMLADAVRNAAFHEALRRVIVPGRTTVADIGCGTGLLAFMASRLPRFESRARPLFYPVAREATCHQLPWLCENCARQRLAGSDRP